MFPWKKLREDNQVLASALLLLIRKVEAMQNQEMAAALNALSASVERAVTKLGAMHDDAAMTDMAAQRDAALADLNEMRDQMAQMQAKLDAAAPPA
jgi:ribosomal protein S20